MAGRLWKRNLSFGNISDGLLYGVGIYLPFLFGGVCGFLFALVAGDRLTLTVYLRDYFRASCGGAPFSLPLLSVIWSLLKWPLIAALLQTTQIRGVVVPVTIFSRAFLLSHAISVFLFVFGTTGLLLTLMVFGISVFWEIPVFFLAGSGAFSGRAKERGGVFLRYGIPLLALSSLGLVSVIQWRVIPKLLSVICGDLFV